MWYYSTPTCGWIALAGLFWLVCRTSASHSHRIGSSLLDLAITTLQVPFYPPSLYTLSCLYDVRECESVSNASSMSNAGR